jgi:hypothetical protein
MTLLLKDPDAVLDYAIDWASEYLLGDLIADSQWSVVPDETGGVAIVGSQFDSSTTTVKASGGLTGRIYRLVNHVVLESGRTDNRSVVLRVEKR